MNESEQWFFVHDGEHSEGVSKVTLQGMIRDGQLGADVPVFREGMSDWIPASEMGLVPNVPSSDQLRSEIARDTVPKKTAIALIAVIVLTALTSVAGLWWQSSKHKSDTSKLNTDLSNLQTKLTQTQTDLKNYTGSTNQTHLLITNLRSNLAVLQPQVASLSNTVNNLKVENSNYVSGLSFKDDEIKKLTEKIDELNGSFKIEQAARQAADRQAATSKSQIEATRRTLTNTVAQAKQAAEQLNLQFQTDKVAIQKQLADAATAQEKLNEQIQTLQGNLNQANQVITNLQAQLGQTPIRIGDPDGPKPPVDSQPFGQIGSVDEQFNFAVINRGSEDGVKAGDTFRIVSKETGEFLLQLKIDRVQASIAVGSPGTLSVKALKPEDLVYRE
jgi:peptidoglycan hydrolase CwlO-like protein